MKRAQATTIVIIAVLVIIAIAFIVIALNLSSNKSSITGNVAREQNIPTTETSDIVCNSPYIRVRTNCCLDKNNNGICDTEEVNNIYTESVGKYTTGTAIVTPPFYVNAWNVKASAGVTLELKNNGAENYNIKSIEISNCGKIFPNKFIFVNNKEIFYIPCPLISGTTFNGDITIIYSKQKSNIDLTSTGTIIENVE